VRSDVVAIHAYWRDLAQQGAVAPDHAAELRIYRLSDHLRRWLRSNCGTDGVS